MVNQKESIKKTSQLKSYFPNTFRLGIGLLLLIVSSSFLPNPSHLPGSSKEYAFSKKLDLSIANDPKMNIKETLFDQGKDSFPIPPTNPKQLFYLQRTANTNTIIVDINMNAKGQLDPANPVHVYWIRYAEKGEKKELNYIQRTFAYGIKSEAINSTNFWIHFVSYAKLKFKLTFSAKENKYIVLASINKKEAILKKLFVKIDGGSFWVPNVLYMEMKGIDPITGKEVVERFKP